MAEAASINIIKLKTNSVVVVLARNGSMTTMTVTYRGGNLMQWPEI